VKRFGLILLLCMAAVAAHAETTAYISDQLRVSLRAGQSDQQPILRMLPSGTEVTVLQNDPGSGYSRVRTENGVEGWVYTAYLMKEPAARERLQAAEKRADELEQEKRRIESESKAQSELVSNAEALDRENKSLNSRIVALETELDMLKQDNATLRDSTRREWFLIGGGVLLVGMVIGLIVPKIRWRKKSSWDAF